LGFDAAVFSEVLVVFLSPVFWCQAGGASTGVGIISANILPTELFKEPLLGVFLELPGASIFLFFVSIYF